MSQEGSNSILEDSNHTTPTTPEAIIQPKQKPKVIRVLTVLVYMLSVSMAAILLSAYYIFMYDSQPTLARKAYPQARLTMGKDFQEYQILVEGSPENLPDKGAEVFTNDTTSTISKLRSVLERSTYQEKDEQKINQTYEIDRDTELNTTQFSIRPTKMVNKSRGKTFSERKNNENKATVADNGTNLSSTSIHPNKTTTVNKQGNFEGRGNKTNIKKDKNMDKSLRSSSKFLVPGLTNGNKESPESDKNTTDVKYKRAKTIPISTTTEVYLTEI